MIRIGMVTTVPPERCGLRVYSEELVMNAIIDNTDLHFEFIGRPFDGASIVKRSMTYDIVHVQHVQNLHAGIRPEHIHSLRSLGKKTLCTYHETTSFNRNDYTAAFDRVVVHQKTTDGFDLIYHGVPWKSRTIPEGRLREFIGTSGFPLPFKNYPLAAKLAQSVGMKLLAILPISAHGDANQVEREIMQICPGSIVKKEFPTHSQIVEWLSECAFTLFPYSHTFTGIGGSMRVGIGALRPVVISNVVRFQDVLEEERFRNEFYVIPSAYPTFENSIDTVRQCAIDIQTGQARVPVQTFREMNWRTCANKYVRIYRDLMETA